MRIDFPLTIAGLGALSALGEDVASHHRAIMDRRAPFQRLGELLGPDSPHARRPGAWIENRAVLTHRKWSPATMAALHVAREAITDAGWTADDLRDAALVVGTSRGNAAGWLGPWPGRRPFKLMAGSNTIHSEPAAAISIEFQITGPNHVLASGCAAGLDAIGMAMMMVRCGPRRALWPSRWICRWCRCCWTTTLRPESCPIICCRPLSTWNRFRAGGRRGRHGDRHHSADQPRLMHYGCNSDACDPVGIPADGGRTPELFNPLVERRFGRLPSVRTPPAPLCRPRPIPRRLPGPSDRRPSLHLLKPFLGHTIGASGLLESVILAGFLRSGQLPPNLSGLYVPAGFDTPDHPVAASGPVAKLSHGMGGHNALLVLTPPWPWCRRDSGNRTNWRDRRCEIDEAARAGTLYGMPPQRGRQDMRYFMLAGALIISTLSTVMSTKNKKSAPTGIRYTDAQKKEVVDFVAQYNSANGRGGQSAAASEIQSHPAHHLGMDQGSRST